MVEPARHPHRTMSEPAALARRLLEAQLRGQVLPREEGQLDLGSAYAVQREGGSLRVAAGERMVGHKVGLTSGPARVPFGAEEPVSGYLVASTVLEQSDTYSLAGLTNPRVEAEVAFVMGSSLSGEHVTAEQVVTATSEVTLALEIVASRWSGGAGSVGLLVADNVSAAGVLVGRRSSPHTADLDEVAVEVTVGNAVVQGHGGNVFDHPAKSVAWLVSHLTRSGRRLEAGDLAMSGSLITPVPVAPGDHLVADYGALGRITTTFTN